MFKAMPFKTERAWSGGPLRKVGTGNGSASKFVCEGCRKPAVGVYRTRLGWVCQGCKSPKRSNARVNTPNLPVGGGVLRVRSPQVVE